MDVENEQLEREEHKTYTNAFVALFCMNRLDFSIMIYS